MKTHKKSVLLSIILTTVLIAFLSYLYAIQVKSEQIQKATYIFNHTVNLEKKLMQPEFVSFPKSNTCTLDSTIVITEKGRVVYKNNKEAAKRLTLSDKREWALQMFFAYKNPNRAFTLDSIFQEQLKTEGIIAQTAVSFSQGDSLVSNSNKLLSQAGIALPP